MIPVGDVRNINFDSISIDTFWNTGEEKELKMHRIHAYPAKFPAFITTKALAYAEKTSLEIKTVADVFCGCGTVAFEALRNNINFWGCDINPVATMIARVKSHNYQPNRLKRYYDKILELFSKTNDEDFSYEKANERLKHWYSETQYKNLSRLKLAIENTVPPNSNYRLFFLCAFSNILKATSRWLTKSIKPQLDPEKKPADAITAFKEQCLFMMLANKESDVSGHTKNEIVTGNFLDTSVKRPVVDMIITSPPYVTSYEYADLHQLSSLWLGFVDDYRNLRNGSIGSLYHVYNFEEDLESLNTTGKRIVFDLFNQFKSKARSVSKYFIDMQKVAKECHSMLSDGGMVVFVIGNTEYKGVRIDNARHLAESLQSCGFSEVLVTKRKITKKILTPYRDERGRFTTDSGGRKVYGEEFILIGSK